MGFRVVNKAGGKVRWTNEQTEDTAHNALRQQWVEDIESGIMGHFTPSIRTSTSSEYIDWFTAHSSGK